MNNDCQILVSFLRQELQVSNDFIINSIINTNNGKGASPTTSSLPSSPSLVQPDSSDGNGISTFSGSNNNCCNNVTVVCVKTSSSLANSLPPSESTTNNQLSNTTINVNQPSDGSINVTVENIDNAPVVTNVSLIVTNEPINTTPNPNTIQSQPNDHNYNTAFNIVAIRLDNLNLNGSINANSNLAKLSQLQYLSLYQNNLNGSLPEDLFPHLTKLNTL
jgi:hypothetical protein